MFPSRALAEQQICQMDDGTFERKIFNKFFEVSEFPEKDFFFYSDITVIFDSVASEKGGKRSAYLAPPTRMLSSTERLHSLQF